MESNRFREFLLGFIFWFIGTRNNLSKEILRESQKIRKLNRLIEKKKYELERLEEEKKKRRGRCVELVVKFRRSNGKT